ncbi:MAG: hypothetical protein WCL14_04630 [Bacteroidota bacterium]
MKISKQLLLSITTLFALCVSAQVKNENISASNSISNNTTIETKELFQRKGNAFFYWGYNRATYTKSDMHFWGDGYDFSITNIRADDQPTTDFMTYVSPSTVSVPQFNFRMGYYLSDKTFICIGWDHMKYGMVKQATHLTGMISKDNNGGKNIGVYNNTEVVVGDEDENSPVGPSIIDSLPNGFLTNFEHCDGLNDVTFELGQHEQIWISKNGQDALSVIGTIAFGAVVPDTDADVLGYPPHHDMESGKKGFHLAGYSFSTSIGLQFDFFKHFFALARVKAGYINLPDIMTTTTGGKASQHFDFLEPMFVVGYTHSLCKK